MIERTSAFKVGDQSFLTLADAQRFELKELVKPQNHPAGLSVGDFIDVIMDNKVKILDILTTTSASKPKARKINGGAKPRKVGVPKLDDKTWSPLTPIAIAQMASGEKVIVNK
jgi:hypothetical protein